MVQNDYKFLEMIEHKAIHAATHLQYMLLNMQWYNFTIE